MNLKLLCILGLAALTTGCVMRTELRASSWGVLPAKDSQLLVTAPEDAIARRLIELFSKRGQALIDRKEHQTGTLYVFKGPRLLVTTVAVDPSVNKASKRIGSIYYVLMTAQEGHTRVELYGKPLFDGNPVCGNQDPSWALGCAPLVIRENSSSRAKMTGREEAETLRSIMLEMEMGSSETPGFVVQKAPEPGPMVPTCVAQELPEWESADARTKRDLLRKCAQPELRATDATP